MKLHRLLQAAVLTIWLLGNIPLTAQDKWTPADIMAKAKPGMWVKLEGMVQEDLSVLAGEIRFLTGDFMDDDWELKAKVDTVGPAENSFQVLAIPVKVTRETDFDKGIRSMDDIKPGMFIELEGTYLKDGVFLAKEIEDVTDRKKNRLPSERKIEAVGKVGQVDETKGTISVMGIQFYITEKTEGRSPIR
jgi:hypothetical protein